MEAGRLALREDLPKPRRRPGLALIRVTMVGICGTDLALMMGYAGFSGVPGHEFVGVVEAAGGGGDQHHLWSMCALPAW